MVRRFWIKIEERDPGSFIARIAEKVNTDYRPMPRPVPSFPNREEAEQEAREWLVANVRGDYTGEVSDKPPR